MKVLLDENLDHRLRHWLSPHEVFTVSYMGWSGLKNGTLLRAAEEASFAILLTGDQTLPEEQNLANHSIAVVTLTSIEWRILRTHLEQIIHAISSAKPGTVTSVPCGTFSRSGNS